MSLVEKSVLNQLSILGLLEQIFPGSSSLLSKLFVGKIGADDIVFAGPLNGRSDLLKEAPGKPETIWETEKIKETEKAVNVRAVYGHSPDKGEFYSIYLKGKGFGRDRKVCEISVEGVPSSQQHEYLLSEVRKRLNSEKVVIHAI
jgi:hypothetical protein